MNGVLALTDPRSATLYWYVVRGSGFITLVLLTAGVALGLLLSLRWRSDAWPRLLTEDLHQYVQWLAGVFLAIHIVSTLFDSFVHFLWYQLFVPFIGPYRVVWMGLGIIAMYLGIVLALSVYVRRFVGYRAWRSFHYAGFVAWILAMIHAVATGTDTRTIWGIAVYGVCLAIIVSGVSVRFGGIPVPLGQPPQLRLGALAALGGVLLLGGALAVMGPLQSGWAARAGAITGPRVVVRVPKVSIKDRAIGIATPYDEFLLTSGYKMLTLDISGVGQYPMSLVYRVLVKRTGTGIRFVRGLFSLSPASLEWNCSGAVSLRPPDQLVSTCRPTANDTLHVVAAVRIDIMGRVTGSVSVTPRRAR